MEMDKLNAELDNLRRELDYYVIYEPDNNSSIDRIESRISDLVMEIDEYMEKEIKIVCVKSCYDEPPSIGNIQLQRPVHIERGTTFTVDYGDYYYGGGSYLRLYIDVFENKDKFRKEMNNYEIRGIKNRYILGRSNMMIDIFVIIKKII